MGKTFLLTAVVLTGVLGLGGGVLNMAKLGEVTPAQLVGLMALVLPLAAALTLPIAALFSATSTYGRLSADNELVACRSSGINLHGLFLPTILLSLVAAGVSFALTNMLIPGMARNLNEFVGSDVGALIRQRLHQPRGIALGDKYRIYADESRVDADNANRVTLHRIAFVEVDGQEWARYGTARTVDLVFKRNDSHLRVAGWMRGLSYYDRKSDSFFEEDRQAIPTNDLPVPVPQRIKFLTLKELLYYWSHPMAWGEVQRKMRRLRRAFASRLIYQELARDRAKDDVLTLSDDRIRLTVRSEDGGLIARDRGVELLGVTAEERTPERHRRIRASRAILELSRGETLAEGGIKIELYDAQLTDGATTVHKAKVVWGPMAIDPKLIQRVEAVSDAQLLQPQAAPAEDPISQRRQAVLQERGRTVRRIVGTLSERTAFSASALVLVILGAVLGIVFRGAHVMTAFGISFIPGLIVIITIVTGKQMSHNATTHGLGLLLMWSGIAGVAGLDVWTLTRVLRR